MRLFARWSPAGIAAVALGWQFDGDYSLSCALWSLAFLAAVVAWGPRL